MTSPAPEPPLSPPAPPRRPWFRFSLRTLLLAALLAGSGMLVWAHWAPWESGVVFRGHGGAVISAALAPDDRRAVTCGYEDIRVWGIADGKELLRIKRWMRRAVFSPDGRRIAGCSSHVEWWDSATGERLPPPPEPSGVHDLRTLAFSPDGRYLVVAVYDGTAWLWDLANGGPARILRGHAGCTTAVAFSPDSSTLATGDAEGGIRIWDAVTGRALHQFRAGRAMGDLGVAVSPQAVATVCFTPDGAAVVTAHEGGLVAAWDVTTGNPLITMQEDGWMTRWAACPTLAPRIYHTTCNQVRVRARNGALRATLTGHEDNIYSADVSPDGTRVATASEDGTARVWQRRHPEEWWGVAWLPAFWLTVALAGAVAWSIRRDRTTLPAPPRTA